MNGCRDRECGQVGSSSRENKVLTGEFEENQGKKEGHGRKAESKKEHLTAEDKSGWRA